MRALLVGLCAVLALAGAARAVTDDAYTDLKDGQLDFVGVDVVNGATTCTGPEIEFDVADFDCSCTASGVDCSLETNILHFTSGCVDGASLCTTVDRNNLDDGRDGRTQLPTGTTPVTCSTGNASDVFIDTDATPSGLSYANMTICDGTGTPTRRTMREAKNEVHTFCIPYPSTSVSDLPMFATGMGRPFKLVRVCCEHVGTSASIQFERRIDGDAQGAGDGILDDDDNGTANALSCSTNADLDGTTGCATDFVDAENLIEDGHKLELDVVAVSAATMLCVTYEVAY